MLFLKNFAVWLGIRKDFARDLHNIQQTFEDALTQTMTLTSDSSEEMQRKTQQIAKISTEIEEIKKVQNQALVFQANLKSFLGVK